MYIDSASITPNGQLGIIALESCKELGAKIDYYLQKERKNNLEGHHSRKESNKETFLISAEEVRFSNGEGKM
ncbi:hypothetical protein [Sporanaerobacter sp. PP17-6a]|uniref:hypothetical protein n=1 Tax=Sporanaerobacter sp. PP17-6a TaxID=1891289 RepID=UPI00089FD53C|nr:hypothetical protein [Sporanaerobacter sp. PP17-6a]SCL92938.1 phosphoribosylpyrophosphate synthetase [Sporanaerobacter sp. PP17-6a]